MKKLAIKSMWIILIILVTYPLTGISTFKYSTLGELVIFWEEPRHQVGYFIIGLFFGWVTMIFAILDELIQIIVPFKEGSLMQLVRNFIGAVIGTILWLFIRIKIRFKNPWR